MTREKSKWEKVVDEENAKDKLNTTLSVDVLLDAYERDWNKISKLTKLFGSKKMCGRLCYLAGSVEGMNQLVKVAKEKEKNESK